MSLRIIKAGILDTIQDLGRYGFQAMGINPGGSADRFAAQLANALLGKSLNAPVLECFFPAAQILFNSPTIICITGADFTPTINGKPVPLAHPVAVDSSTILHFERPKQGNCCYLATLQDLATDNWLQSTSTNIKAKAGGHEGRALRTGDELSFNRSIAISAVLKQEDFTLLPWHAAHTIPDTNKVHFIFGSEWHWLTDDAKTDFQKGYFQITPDSDRMGYRLKGAVLSVKESESLVSSGVSYGTIQLLPHGQLIVLMADHQTTGGYPKVAHVISSDLSILAQKHAGNNICFQLISLDEAEKKQVAEQKILHQLQNACKFKIENLIHAAM